MLCWCDDDHVVVWHVAILLFSTPLFRFFPLTKFLVFLFFLVFVFLYHFITAFKPPTDKFHFSYRIGDVLYEFMSKYCIFVYSCYINNVATCNQPSPATIVSEAATIYRPGNCFSVCATGFLGNLPLLILAACNFY